MGGGAAMTRREALGAAMATALATPTGALERPNVVFILADDLGWADVGCQGSRYYETPNIDRLAREGVRFTHFRQCPNCAPTRAALLTGCYAPRTGIYTVGSLERGRDADRRMRVPTNVTDLPVGLRTFADQLRAAGYATAVFGKWHLGVGAAFHPARRGFDEAIVSDGRHFDFATDPPVEHPRGQYLADFLTERAEDFIQRHVDRPFLLYLPHFAVHSPYEAKPALIERFRRRRPVGGQGDPVYAAMVASVDESVGRVMARLGAEGLDRRTLVIFASDNGGVGGYGEIGGTGVTDNRPLRGGKGMLYEGGTRVPFAARWPGVVPAGRSCSEAATHVDLLPTLLEAAAAPPPGQPRDGVSLLPLMRRPGARLAPRSIFQHMPGYLEGYGVPQWRTTPAGSIIRGDWKLIEFFEDGRLELYDLRSDPGERRNLAQARPAITGDLLSRMRAWRRETGAAMPAPRTAPAANLQEQRANTGRTEV